MNTNRNNEEQNRTGLITNKFDIISIDKIEDLDNMPGVISALESLLELVESGTTHPKIRQTIKNEINRILEGDPETKLTGGSSKRGSSFTKLINCIICDALIFASLGFHIILLI